MLRKISFKPGIVRDVTKLSSEGGWCDGSLVRFLNGFPQKIGGWTKLTSTLVQGTIRNLFNWTTLSNANVLGIGTSYKYYIEYINTVYDITPIRTTLTGTGVISTTNTSRTIGIYVPAHGAVTNDFVTISGVASAVSGIPADEINANHQLTVVDVDNIQVTVPTTAATASASGLGGSISMAFEVNTSLFFDNTGDGWGSWVWGRGSWGSAYQAGSALPVSIRLWTADNFGESLVINPRYGALYFWNANYGPDARAVALADIAGATDVPAASIEVGVGDDRHVIAYGAAPIGLTYIDPLFVRWSDQEDYANWTPSAITTAGGYRLPSGSKIVTHKKTRQETLIWTDADLYSQQFTGPPYTFSFTRLAENISIASSQAAASASNVVYWMGIDKFYVYSGRVETLECPMRDYVFNNWNFDNRDLIVSGTNEKYNEIWWFYPSAGSSTPDKYIIFNYVLGIWYDGTLSRTAWLDTPLREFPVAALNDQLFYHESGLDDGSTETPSAITAYVTSSYMDIDDGDRFYYIQRLVPDLLFENSTAATPSVTMKVAVRRFPGVATNETATTTTTRTSASPVDLYTKQIWIRLRGREMSFTIQSSALGVAWQLGAVRLEYQPDGRR